MKKILIILLLFLVSPVFAKTVQCVRKYQVQADSYSTYDVTPAIQSMINMGWKVVSITPITIKYHDTNPTDYVIVLFERDE
jgi:hypothetical protein